MTDVRVLRVPVHQLEAARFARYGTLVQAGDVDADNLNRSPGQMGFMWVHRMLQYPRPPFLATCRYYYRGLRCDYLQRHPESTVVLVPVGRHASIIVLAPTAHDGGPALDEAEGFLLDGSKGVVVEPNTWIRYAYPLFEFADFVYVSARLDADQDIEHVYLDRDRGVVLELALPTPEGQGVRRSAGGAVVALPRRTSHPRA
jgi:ureidoglycolate hydrolase